MPRTTRRSPRSHGPRPPKALLLSAEHAPLHPLPTVTAIEPAVTAAIREAIAPAVPTPARASAAARSARPRRGRLALALATVLAVIGGGVIWLTGDESSALAQVQPPATAAAAAPAAPPAVVSVAEVQRMEFLPLSWVSASVHSRGDARLAAEVGGRVLSIADVGTRLRRGEPLAQLDRAAAELAAAEQQARIGRLRVEAEQAERQLARYRQLGDAGHVSGLQLDEAESGLAALTAQRVEAEAALAQIHLQIERARLLAPFDGVVVERFAADGEMLAAGAPVLRLVDTADLEVRARAPVALASSLRAGSKVELRVGDVSHPLSLGTVVPVGDEVSRQLELRLPLHGLSLPVGTALELGLPTAAAREVLAVPRDAVVLRREGNHVLRVDADSQAERVAVEVGERHGDFVEVRGALAAGDRIIVRGAERLREGQTVAVLSAEPDADLAALLR
jgi:RND family efflux transporter MFP subunit